MKRVPAVVGALALLACTTQRDRVDTDASGSQTLPVAAAGDMSARIDMTVPAPSESGLHRRYESPLGAKHVLIFLHDRDSVSRTVTNRLQIAERENLQRVVDVTTTSARDVGYQVLRGDSTFIVISQISDYGPDLSLKLFLDPGTKALLKRVDYPPDVGLDSIADQEAAAALGVPQPFVKALKEKQPEPKPGEPWDAHLPTALREHPMPKSTYDEFAAARPELEAVSGWDEESIHIWEAPGPFQVVGDRIWFGKIFYEGEGSAGVGGVGYFDTTRSAYTFLKVPGLAKRSASALLIEDQTLWIGLVGRGEGFDSGGGLLRHDLKSGATQKYSVEGVILRMKRLDNRLYVSTTNGVSVIDGDRLTARYVVEPGIDGKFGLVRISL